MQNNKPNGYRPIGPTSRDLMLKPGYRSTFIPAKNSSKAHGGAAVDSPPTTSNDTQQPAAEEKPIQPFPYPSNFLFTPDQFRFSPSFRNHKISNQEELILRRAGTCFIKQITSKINAKAKSKRHQISARAMCMAMIYFHRFYMYHSLATFLPLEMATTCLFLAAKNEDCPKTIIWFSQIYYLLTHNGDYLEEHETETVNDMIRAYESRLLETLAFEFRIELPHIAIINASFHSEGDRLKKVAWHLSTDLLAYTILCLQYDENILAAVTFYIAGAYLAIDMKKHFGENWLQTICPRLDENILTQIVNSFLRSLKEMEIIIQSKKYELEEGEILY